MVQTAKTEKCKLGVKKRSSVMQTSSVRVLLVIQMEMLQQQPGIQRCGIEEQQHHG